MHTQLVTKSSSPQKFSLLHRCSLAFPPWVRICTKTGRPSATIYRHVPTHSLHCWCVCFAFPCQHIWAKVSHARNRFVKLSQKLILLAWTRQYWPPTPHIWAKYPCGVFTFEANLQSSCACGTCSPLIHLGPLCLGPSWDGVLPTSTILTLLWAALKWFVSQQAQNSLSLVFSSYRQVDYFLYP